jgi:DNA polymerase I-like protein with 3'-5' exonuclease and polymerase domains
VDESTLEPLQHIPAVKLLLEYLMVGKRLGQLAEGDQAWLKHARQDGYQGGVLTGLFHIHGGVIQCGTITHRAAHISPNIAQVPSVDVDKDGKLLYGALYGTECRELFFVPKSFKGRSWKQVGIDVSGLELRTMAHYMGRWDDGAYFLVVTEGEVHSTNRDALGLKGKPGRAKAKTFIYAFVYGAGDWKLGFTIGFESEEEAQEFIKKYKGGAAWNKAVAFRKRVEEPFDDLNIAFMLRGGEARKDFLRNIPALGKLIEQVKLAAKENKYLKLIDGRKVHVRSAHSALNMLLQGSGAVICKKWVVNFTERLEREFGPQGWNGKWAGLAWVHDELQLACWEEITADVIRIGIEEIRKLRGHFGLRGPLDGEGKSGHNWAGCH